MGEKADVDPGEGRDGKPETNCQCEMEDGKGSDRSLGAEEVLPDELRCLFLFWLR